MTKSFCVKSDTSDSIYTVTLSKSGHNCSCRWGKYHPNGDCSCLKVCSGILSKHYCKHVEQVGDRKKSVYIDVGTPKCEEEHDITMITTKLLFADVVIQLNQFFRIHFKRSYNGRCHFHSCWIEYNKYFSKIWKKNSRKKFKNSTQKWKWSVPKKSIKKTLQKRK